MQNTDLKQGHSVSVANIKREGRKVQLEYQWLNKEAKNAPLLIFLHEGLGSVSMWRNWPEQVCKQLNCRGLVYSRYGYGQSTTRQSNEQRPIEYIHHEARNDLPAFIAALGLENEKPILFGHSDGGSIALLFAAMYPEKIGAIVVAAPHIFVEEITLQGIKEAKQIFETTDLSARLGRHHRDAESVFWSWNDTWLTEEFKHWNIESEVSNITCPVLAIQGEGDEYGTLEQIYGIQRLAKQTELLVIPDCGHSPHKDQSETVINSLAKFLLSNGYKVNSPHTN